jgi:hypothetical protein
VSLRRDFHSAFDEISPSMQGLSERVVQTVVTASHSRPRRERLVVRMRVPLSLVAVFMLIALVVGLLIGGRLIQDWNSFRNVAPAGGGSQSSLAQLEARPLNLPEPATRAECKSGPFNSVGAFGAGPVFGEAGPSTGTSWGFYFHNFAYAETNISGPILIRVNDLFTHQPVVFVGQYAAGPVVGHDRIDGVTVDQHVELVFDTSQASKTPGQHKFSWPFTAGAPNGWSGSTGWQIDAIGFSEVFVAC